MNRPNRPPPRGAVSTPLAFEEEWIEDEPAHSGRFDWIMPTLAVLRVLGWTGFFAWVNRADILAGASAAQWSAWVIDWAVPVLLVVALWLLAMRNSRREARASEKRRALFRESALLEVACDGQPRVSRHAISSPRNRATLIAGRVEGRRAFAADRLQA